MLCIKLRDPKCIKPIKSWLHDHNYINKDCKITENDGIFIIYTTVGERLVLYEVLETWPSVELEPYQVESKSNNDLDSIVEQLLTQEHVELTGDMRRLIPKRWIIYEPMVLFNSNTFDSDIWQAVLNQMDQESFFKSILTRKFPKQTHIAINKPINKSSVMRVPMNILPLYGDFGPEVTPALLESPTEQDFDEAFWCYTVQNGIYQTWAPRYTMFSRGNIKEKKRLLDTYKSLDNTWVLDLYAGIGYFSLSYLQNGGKLMCWELNPWSTKALVKNCQSNGFSYQLNASSFEAHTQMYIFNENNERSVESLNRLLSAPSHLCISHINLGLLPSSKQSWPLVKRFMTLSSIKPIVHVHENVHVDEVDKLVNEILDYFPGTECVSVNRVKTFAPDVWHMVFDIK